MTCYDFEKTTKFSSHSIKCFSGVFIYDRKAVPGTETHFEIIHKPSL